MAKANKYRQAKQQLDAYYFQLLERLTDDLNDAGSEHDAIERVLTNLGSTLQSARVARTMLASKLNNSYEFDEKDEDQEFSSPGPVPPTGLKINKNTPLQIGQPILTSQSGDWWLATVLSLEPKNKVRVHYDGWEDYFDEVVPRRRIQLREADDLDEDEQEEEEEQPTRRRRR